MENLSLYKIGTVEGYGSWCTVFATSQEEAEEKAVHHIESKNEWKFFGEDFNKKMGKESNEDFFRRIFSVNKNEPYIKNMGDFFYAETA